MKSKGTKFLSMMLVSSMVLTSGLGFAPRMAKAIDDASVYSYSFDYIDTATEKGNKLIVLKVDENLNLTGYDTTVFSVDGGAEIGNVDLTTGAGGEVRIQVDGIDPEVLDYKLTIGAGGLAFNGYQQLDDITIDFKSYDVTPGFKSIFKDEETTNKVFENNRPEEIKIYVDSDYITGVTATTVSGEVNWTEFKVEAADGVDSITYKVLGIAGDNIREVDTAVDGKYPAVFAGVSSTKDVIIKAFDASGKLLDSQTVRYNFGSQFGTNFDASKVKTFNSDGYTVREILDTPETLNTILAGKSYGELGNVKVYYANVDNIVTVNSANELAGVMAKLGAGNELSGKSVKIKLGSDITLGAMPILSHDASLMIEGNNHTITGDIKLGNDEQHTVKLSNATVNGDIKIDVGETADAFLTNVTVGTGHTIEVLSGGYSSVKLIGTTADKMKIDNDTDPIHVIAGSGTIIQDTEVVGDYKVKMTSADGGLFNVIQLKNDEELYLIGDSNSPFKAVNVASGINPNAIIRLAPNTTVENLDVKSKVVMTGTSTSVVNNATVESGLGDGAVSYDGFTIGNASGTQFTGTNLPDGDAASEQELEVPTTSNNKVVLGGTIYGTGTTEENMVSGGKTLTLTLQGAGEDQPLNIKWKSTQIPVNVKNLITATENETDLQGAVSYSVNSSQDVLTITFAAINPFDIEDKLTVTVDSDALIFDMFESKISSDKFNDASATFDATSFASLYKPTFYSNSDASGVLNTFFIYNETSSDIESLGLTVDTTSLNAMKWWKTGGGDMTLSGTTDQMEYKTSTTAWKDASDTNTTIANADLKLGAEGYTEIFVRSKGSTDSTPVFKLEQGQVWFNENSQGAAVATALNDAEKEIDIVNLAYDADQYVLGSDITKRSNETPEISAYDDGSDTSVELLVQKEEQVGYVNSGTKVDVEFRPELISAVYTDVDNSNDVNASDTIAFTFNKAMKVAGAATDITLSDSGSFGTTASSAWTTNKVFTVTLDGTGISVDPETTTAKVSADFKDTDNNDANTDTEVTITGEQFSAAPADGAYFEANAATGEFTVKSAAPTGTYKIYVAGSTTAAGSVEHTNGGGDTISTETIAFVAGNTIEYTFTESGKEESAKVADGSIPYATVDGTNGGGALANADFAVDAVAKTATYIDTSGSEDITANIVYTDDNFTTTTTAATQNHNGTIDVTSLGLAGGETIKAAIVDDATGNTGEAIALGTIPAAPSAGDLTKLAVTHDKKIINRNATDALSLAATDKFVLYENDGGAGLALADNGGTTISLAGNAVAGTESTTVNDTNYASGDKVAYAVVNTDGNTGVTSAEEELTFLTAVAVVDADADAEGQITLVADDVIKYTFGANVQLTSAGTKAAIETILKSGFTDSTGTNDDSLDDITPTAGTTDAVTASGATIQFTVGNSDSLGKTLTTAEDTFEFTNTDDEVVDENGNSVFNAAAPIDPTVE